MGEFFNLTQAFLKFIYGSNFQVVSDNYCIHNEKLHTLILLHVHSGSDFIEVSLKTLFGVKILFFLQKKAFF